MSDLPLVILEPIAIPHPAEDRRAGRPRTNVSPTSVRRLTLAGPALRQRRSRHRTMLCVSLAIVAASLLLRVDERSHVVPAWWPDFGLPVLCSSRAWFGVECPGCGLSRSFIALAGGDWAASLQFHRLGWVMALAVVAQIPYRLYGLSELKRAVPDRAWPDWFGWLLIGLLVGNWLLKACGI